MKEFERIEQRKQSQAYVYGLLGHAARRNVEQMALGLGEKVRSLQYLVGPSLWEVEPAVAVHQRLVAESLGEEDGVVWVDESSVVKQGEDSVGAPSSTMARWARLPMVRWECIWVMPAAKATA